MCSYHSATIVLWNKFSSWNHSCCSTGRARIFPAEAPVIQSLWHHAAVAFWVCFLFVEHHLPRCGLLKQKPEGGQHQQTQRADSESQLSLEGVSILDPLYVVRERRMLSKLFSIMDKASHPLDSVLVSQRSTFSQRLSAAAMRARGSHADTLPPL